MENKHPGGRPRIYTAPFTVRLMPAVHRALNCLAKRERRHPADMLRILLEEALQQRGEPIEDDERPPRARREEEA